MVSLERLVVFIPEKLSMVHLVISNILVFWSTPREHDQIKSTVGGKSPRTSHCFCEIMISLSEVSGVNTLPMVGCKPLHTQRTFSAIRLAYSNK